MSNLNIHQYLCSTDRHQVIVIICHTQDMGKCITQLQSEGVQVLNIGKEMAGFISELKDHRYLNIECYDFVRNLLDIHKTKITGAEYEMVAVYNLGILLEPELDINASQLISDFSKSAALVIVWENSLDMPDILTWKTQQKKYYIDLCNIRPKTISYAV